MFWFGHGGDLIVDPQCTNELSRVILIFQVWEHQGVLHSCTLFSTHCTYVDTVDSRYLDLAYLE